MFGEVYCPICNVMDHRRIFDIRIAKSEPCFLLPPGIFWTIKMRKLSTNSRILLHLNIFFYFLQIFGLTNYAAYLYVLYCHVGMASPFVIEIFKPVFEKYLYMSYSYIGGSQPSLLTVSKQNTFPFISFITYTNVEVVQRWKPMGQV